MPFDASAVCAAVNEINTLSSGKIEKIYQPERDEIMLLVKKPDGAKRLVISANSANPRLCLVSASKENPSDPPMFCMLMRKHISGGRIINVSQWQFERIADIEIESRNEMGDLVRKHIICEIMGKNSNIILTDENMKIIDAIKHVDISLSRVRNVFPGLTYHLPPDSSRLNPLEMTAADFYDALSNCAEGKNIDKALTGQISGISPLLAREAAYIAIGTPSVTIGEMSDDDKKKCASSLFEMFQNVKNGDFSPCVIYEKGKTSPMDFSAIAITQYGDRCDCNIKSTMCEAMEEYYHERDVAERMRSRSYALMKTVSLRLERTRKKIVLLHNTLTDAENREKYRIAGDIITANLYRMNTGDKSLTAVNYYDENQADITIKLDEAKSPSRNAQQYYKKYTKAKTAEIEATKQLELANAEAKYLESVILEIETAKTPSELAEIRRELIDEGIVKNDNTKKKMSRKSTVSTPTAYHYKGYEIFSGRNNVQNDYLTIKLGRSNDLWLHTKNIPGSHVLIKYKGEDFPNDVIETACIIAATNSKGVNSPKVEVDFCPVSHVRKPNGAKAGMVIYEGYNTAYVAPDKVLCEKLSSDVS